MTDCMGFLFISHTLKSSRAAAKKKKTVHNISHCESQFVSISTESLPKNVEVSSQAIYIFWKVLSISLSLNISFFLLPNKALTLQLFRQFISPSLYFVLHRPTANNILADTVSAALRAEVQRSRGKCGHIYLMYQPSS